MPTVGTSEVSGVPVIIKNKIVYGYCDKATQAYDMGVADYNDLTEEEQLDGAIRFIQGVDAPQANNSVWNKLGTTPLTTGLPEDCSQAINQLNASLVNLNTYSTTEKVIGTWIDGKPIYRKCFNVGTLTNDTSWRSLAHGISNLGIVTLLIGRVTSTSDSRQYTIPIYRPSTFGITLGCDNTNIYYTNNWITGSSAVFIIEYTKTTD